MSLSDHEWEILSKLEKQLAKDDPKLQSKLQGRSTAASGKQIILGFILFVVGFSVILAGVIAKFPLLGIAGFVMALVGLILFQSLFHLREHGFVAGDSRQRQTKRARRSIYEILEERWERRQFGE